MAQKTVKVPLTLSEIAKIEAANEKIMEKYWDVFYQEYDSAEQRQLDLIDIKKTRKILSLTDDLIKRNPSTRNKDTPSIEFDCYTPTIDIILSNHFKILKQTAQVLVYDCGTFILKSVQGEDRLYRINITSTDLRNLKVSSVAFPTYDGTDFSQHFTVQEKLVPIDPKTFQAEIWKLYYSEFSEKEWKAECESSIGCMTWTWGLDADNRPKAVDWD